MRQQDRQRDALDNQEAGHEAPQVDNGRGRGRAVHEVIGRRKVAAKIVGERREDVGGYDEEREVLVPEGGGEDYEEEADGEDLGRGQKALGKRTWKRERWGGEYEGEGYYGFETGGHAGRTGMGWLMEV